MTAARYEQVVSKTLDRLRAMPPIGPVSRGDINALILRIRDCSSAIEADGWVTQAEASRCNAMIMGIIRQRRHEIMLSSTPEQWAQWGQQAKAALGQH